MNIRRNLLLLLLSVMPLWLSAQYNIPQNKVWTMNKKAGLDFNTSPPSVISSMVTNTEGSASVCNNAGVLQFYTEGTTVWTASGAVMPHGLNINGIPDQTMSITQGSLIVPVPKSSNRYYLFTLSRDLYVNVVDMNLNNGNGDIDLTFPLRGNIIADSLGEKMIAIRGCHDNIWVLVRRYWENKFYAFEITASGISTTPVISSGGHSNSVSYYQGEMKAAPDGSKVILCNSTSSGVGLELFRFDQASGMAFQPVIVDSIANPYGGAFSPDGTKFYASDFNTGKFSQYDLNNNFAQTVLGNAQGITQVKLAVDGKVYFISQINSFSIMGNTYLWRVNQPNLTGIACQFQDSVTALAFTNSLTTGLTLNLPNDVVVPGGESGVSNRLILDTGFCLPEPFPDIALNAFAGFTGYVWDNGTSVLSRTVNQGGTYWVTYLTVCGRRTDTFKINNGLPGMLQIQYNAPVLSAGNNYSSYQWYKNGAMINGATSPTLSATDTGWYSLKVMSAQGCTDSAAYHLTKGATGIDELDPAAAIIIYPNPAKDIVHIKTDLSLWLRLSDAEGRILEEKKDNEISIARYASGVYLLQIREAQSGRLIKVHKMIK